MSDFVWEAIDGFNSLNEYEKFVEYIHGQVNAGFVVEIDAELDYHYGEVYGGRWYKDLNSGQIWRLVQPDFPFKGLWEPVKAKQLGSD